MQTKKNVMTARKISVRDRNGNVDEAVAFFDKNDLCVDPTKNDEYTEEEIKRMTDEAFEYGESLD